MEAGAVSERTPPMRDAALVAALNNATSMELYQMAALVERLMTDPRRIVAIRKDLHLGQRVKVYDSRADITRPARIVALGDTQLTVQGTEHRFDWKLPYAAIEPLQAGENAAPPATPAAAPKPSRADFVKGDKVSFVDRHLQAHVGVITRCNPKTASVASDDMAWTVPYRMLRIVLDI